MKITDRFLTIKLTHSKHTKITETQTLSSPKSWNSIIEIKGTSRLTENHKLKDMKTPTIKNKLVALNIKSIISLLVNVNDPKKSFIMIYV